MKIQKISLYMLVCLLLSSCVVKPTVESQYDHHCQIVKKDITLSVEQLGRFNGLHCSGHHQCKAQFLGQVVGTAVLFSISAIVSGSISVVGNTMYWLSEQGKCQHTGKVGK